MDKLKDIQSKIVKNSIPVNNLLMAAFNEEVKKLPNIPERTSISGLGASMVLAVLINRQIYHRNNNELDQKGYFFISRKQLMSRTGLSWRQIDAAVRLLVKMDLINTVPYPGQAKRFKINQSKAERFLKDIHGDQIDEPLPNGKGINDNPAHMVTPPKPNGNAPIPYGNQVTSTKDIYYEEVKTSPSTLKGNELKELITLYRDLFKQKTGNNPTINQRDGKVIKDMLEERGQKDTANLIRLYFKYPSDNEKESGYPISWLPRAVNRLLQKMIDEKKSLRSGQWFGESDADYFRRKREFKSIGIPSNIICYSNKAYFECKKLALEEINNPGSINKDELDEGTRLSIEGILAKYNEEPEIKKILQENQSELPLLQIVDEQL